MFVHMRGWLFPILILALVILFLFCLTTGSVAIPVLDAWRALFSGEAADPAWVTIVREVRLPEATTALLAGAGLATGGMLMQTLFGNPLAGPDVLGVTSGSSLGVALVMLAHPLWAAFLPAEAAVVLAAVTGAFILLALILGADRRVGDGVTLLIIGLMIGYVCGALINVLQSASAAGALKGFVQWGMGSFAGVTLGRLPWLIVPVLAGIAAALWMMKPLDALLLGEDHATSVGVDVGRTRKAVIVIAGVMTGSITAFCGPVAFIGLTAPHVARGIVGVSSHRMLLPTAVLTGAAIALFCEVIVRNTGPEYPVPLNAVASLLGAPVVLWVLLRGGRWRGALPS
jgi:iron complex transport system permease protein